MQGFERAYRQLLDAARSSRAQRATATAVVALALISASINAVLPAHGGPPTWMNVRSITSGAARSSASATPSAASPHRPPRPGTTARLAATRAQVRFHSGAISGCGPDALAIAGTSRVRPRPIVPTELSCPAARLPRRTLGPPRRYSLRMPTVPTPNPRGRTRRAHPTGPHQTGTPVPPVDGVAAVVPIASAWMCASPCLPHARRRSNIQAPRSRSAWAMAVLRGTAVAGTRRAMSTARPTRPSLPACAVRRLHSRTVPDTGTAGQRHCARSRQRSPYAVPPAVRLPSLTGRNRQPSPALVGKHMRMVSPGVP